MPKLGEEVEHLVDEITVAITRVLGDQLAGVYLYGSFVQGGFDPHISDLDLLAATERDVDDVTLARLLAMHEDIAARYPAWHDRVEVAYLSRGGLRTFREQRTSMGIISPGEPLHYRLAGPDWMMNWYLVREQGRTLLGPPPEELIPPISKAEFLAALDEHARWRYTTIDEVRGLPSQSYTVLTMCRTLRARRTGELVSKREAAHWVTTIYPKWARLMQLVLDWREQAAVLHQDNTPVRPDVLAFVRTVAAEETNS